MCFLFVFIYFLVFSFSVSFYWSLHPISCNISSRCCSFWVSTHTHTPLNLNPCNIKLITHCGWSQEIFSDPHPFLSLFHPPFSISICSTYLVFFPWKIIKIWSFWKSFCTGNDATTQWISGNCFKTLISPAVSIYWQCTLTLIHSGMPTFNNTRLYYSFHERF